MFAETALVGCLLRDADVYPRIMGEVTEADFSDANLRKVFRAITLLAENEKPHDPPTVGEILGNIEQPIAIAQSAGVAANVEYYAQVIRQAAQRRAAAELLRRTESDLESQDLQTTIAELQGKLDSLMRREAGTYASLDEALHRGLETIDRASAARAEKGSAGVPTGLPTLDAYTGGLQAPRLIVLAARPSIGKTAISNQAALHAASKGYGVGFCSLEMGLDEIAIRTIAHRCAVNGSALAFGHEFEIQQMGQLYRTSGLQGLPYFIDDQTFTLGGIVARITEWKRKHDIALAIVDHIGLVEVDANSANERLGKISRALKVLCKRLNMPILAVSQLNRNVEKEKRCPVLADLRDSGSIEQDADIAVFLHASDVKALNRIPIEIGLLKNRGGRKGWLPSLFEFNGATQTFRELEATP